MKCCGLLFNPACPLCIISLYNVPALHPQPNEVVFEKDCETKCTCKPDTGLVCEEHSCPKNTKCMVKKGIRACYSTGKIFKINCYFVFH